MRILGVHSEEIGSIAAPAQRAGAGVSREVSVWRTRKTHPDGRRVRGERAAGSTSVRWRTPHLLPCSRGVDRRRYGITPSTRSRLRLGIGEAASRRAESSVGAQAWPVSIRARAPRMRRIDLAVPVWDKQVNTPNPRTRPLNPAPAAGNRGGHVVPLSIPSSKGSHNRSRTGSSGTSCTPSDPLGYEAGTWRRTLPSGARKPHGTLTAMCTTFRIIRCGARTLRGETSCTSHRRASLLEQGGTLVGLGRTRYESRAGAISAGPRA